MLLKKLFDQQAIFEARIIELSGVQGDNLGSVSGSDLRFLALYVKISELANVTKCYKFTGKPVKFEESKIVSRYLEILQYFLSIGIQHNFNMISDENIEKQIPHMALAPLILEIFKSVQSLKEFVEMDDFFEGLKAYGHLFSLINRLGEFLNITEEQIMETYRKFTPSDAQTN